MSLFGQTEFVNDMCDYVMNITLMMLQMHSVSYETEEHINLHGVLQCITCLLMACSQRMLSKCLKTVNVNGTTIPMQLDTLHNKPSYTFGGTAGLHLL